MRHLIDLVVGGEPHKRYESSGYYNQPSGAWRGQKSRAIILPKFQIMRGANPRRHNLCELCGAGKEEYD